MSNVIIVGAQWGDEGKGKIVDFLTEDADVVVRGQGGNNAGHTVYNKGEKYVLHLMPSGILWDDKQCVVGNGVVLDPIGLLEEIEGLEKRGIAITPDRLRLSSNAHLVFPYHRLLDQARERQRGGSAIGTTGRGIGPAYGDKIARCGLRLNDLLHPERFRRKCQDRVNQLKGLLEDDDYEAIGKAVDEYLEIGKRFAPHVTNTVAFLHKALKANKNLLFESAQGTFLDIDHGTYPFDIF